MHDDIKRFSLEGYTDNNAETREWAIRELETEMKDKGFSPSIDNDPQYTVNYISEKEGFWFELSVYGIYVGKDKSWDVSGVTSGKIITRSTPLAK